MGTRSSDGFAAGWELVADCSDEHQTMARRFDVEFVVHEGPVRDASGRIIAPPADRGRFADLGEALATARRPCDGRIEMLVNGSGPYWSSDSPEMLNTAALRRACLEAHLGEEGWEQHMNRERLSNQLARFEVLANTQLIVAGISGCETYAEAVEILVEPPFNLDAGLASFVVERDQFRGLTTEGRRELDSIMATITAEIEQLPPLAELPD